MNPTTLAQRLADGPYQAYSYAYPHKSAYRPLPAPQDLAQLWAAENREALFGYVHIPFCSMRCGFCNLFAIARPHADLVSAYVSQLVRQMRVLNETLGERRFARFALGGGTPTYLSAAQLAQILAAARDLLGIDTRSIPAGIEASPETVSTDKLAVCHEFGIARISLGIQSFAAAETRALARPQQSATVCDAIEQIRASGFATLNLDLIYGIAGQTEASLLASVDSALAFAPEEIYLYPLYVRPQTGLGKITQRAGPAADGRQALYWAARRRLLAAGYRQLSMRLFRATAAPDNGGPVYCCQNDGMIGIGPGARSYTRTLHYSSAYAVARSATLPIIEDYLDQTDADFRHASYGFALNREEQQRRFVIQSLLTEPGLIHADYRQRFGTDCLDDLPQLHELNELHWAEASADRLRLNAQGYAYADTIGPWLASAAVNALMNEA
ncbi:MAG: STM4012 family radical SAM protein [Candidatus Methylumidiphilus sp.]